MRKLTVLFIILWSAAGVVQAQKGTAVKNMGKAVTKSSGKGSAGAMVKPPKGPRNLPGTGRVRAGSVVAPAQGNTQSRALTNPQTVQTDATTLVPQAYTGVGRRAKLKRGPRCLPTPYLMIFPTVLTVWAKTFSRFIKSLAYVTPSSNWGVLLLHDTGPNDPKRNPPQRGMWRAERMNNSRYLAICF